VTGAILISLVVYLIMPETRRTSRLDGATEILEKRGTS